MDGSITSLIQLVKNGDELAATRLCQRYWERLVRLVDRRISSDVRGVVGGDDAANMALKSFLVRIRDGRISGVDNRQQLEGILFSMTINKARDVWKHATRKKRRPPGKIVNILDMGGVWDDSPKLGFDPEDPRSRNDAELAAVAAEQLQLLLDALEDTTLRQIAIMTLDGHSTGDIAEQLTCVPRTVQRKLNRIRAIWLDAALA